MNVTWVEPGSPDTRRKGRGGRTGGTFAMRVECSPLPVVPVQPAMDDDELVLVLNPDHPDLDPGCRSGQLVELAVGVLAHYGEDVDDDALVAEVDRALVAWMLLAPTAEPAVEPDLSESPPAAAVPVPRNPRLPRYFGVGLAGAIVLSAALALLPDQRPPAGPALPPGQTERTVPPQPTIPSSPTRRTPGLPPAVSPPEEVDTPAVGTPADRRGSPSPTGEPGTPVVSRASPTVPSSSPSRPGPVPVPREPSTSPAPSPSSSPVVVVPCVDVGGVIVTCPDQGQV